MGRRRVILAVLAGWTALGLLESAKAWLFRPPNAPPGFGTALASNMPWWLVWAALTPVIVWFAARVRLDTGRHRVWVGLAHLGAATVLALLHLVVTGALFFWTTHGTTAPSIRVLVWRWAQGFFILNLLTYGAVVGVYYAVSFARKASRLRQGLAEAKLHALQRELNPHFLFNSLNAVSGLIRRREIDRAVTMLARVGDLLRATLERGDALESTLEAELTLLDLYLEVERARFGPRLTVLVDIPASAGGALVPTLVLQPLVENAVRHGVARVAGPAAIRLRAAVSDGQLVMTVENTGTPPVAGDAPVPGDGIGHANTRARLLELYGDAAGLTLHMAPDGGAVARLWVPYHTESQSLTEGAG